MTEKTVHTVSIIFAAATIVVAFSLVFCFVWWADQKHKRVKAARDRRRCNSLPTYDELFL